MQIIDYGRPLNFSILLWCIIFIIFIVHNVKKKHFRGKIEFVFTLKEKSSFQFKKKYIVLNKFFFWQDVSGLLIITTAMQ